MIKNKEQLFKRAAQMFSGGYPMWGDQIPDNLDPATGELLHPMWEARA